jgi:hypothetical protein
MFRRLELALVQLGAEEHRHYNFRDILVEDFDAKISSGASTREDQRRLFAKVLAEIYIPANQRRVDLLQKHLHLRPPLSFFLFLTHAAQLKSLVLVKQLVNLTIDDHDALKALQESGTARTAQMGQVMGCDDPDCPFCTGMRDPFQSGFVFDQFESQATVQHQVVANPFS